MITALEGGEGSASRPGRSLPPGKTRYTLYRRLGGPQGRSGQVRKISPPHPRRDDLLRTSSKSSKPLIKTAFVLNPALFLLMVLAAEAYPMVGQL
jgi:hypothetical protein